MKSVNQYWEDLKKADSSAILIMHKTLSQNPEVDPKPADEGGCLRHPVNPSNLAICTLRGEKSGGHVSNSAPVVKFSSTAILASGQNATTQHIWPHMATLNVILVA